MERARERSRWSAGERILNGEGGNQIALRIVFGKEVAHGKETVWEWRLGVKKHR